MKQLFAALLKLDLHNIKTDSINPHFKNRYASLEQVIENITPALKKVGLGIIQPISHLDGVPSVKTILFHESGEFIENTYPLVAVQKQDPQGYGGAISYARRYSLLSILNLGVEDDDGQTASQARPLVAPVSTQPKGVVLPQSTKCPVCKSDLTPSKDPGGKAYCKPCFIKRKEAQKGTATRAPETFGPSGHNNGDLPF